MTRVLAALALLLAGAHGRDRTPPVFAGLQSGVTCIAGPVGGGQRATSYTLAWNPAQDDRTPARRIVYDIYAATAAGREHYNRPTWTSRPGATSFATPKLSSSKTWWFVVRARDAAGNRDHNRQEIEGVNVCD